MTNYFITSSRWLYCSRRTANNKHVISTTLTHVSSILDSLDFMCRTVDFCSLWIIQFSFTVYVFSDLVTSISLFILFISYFPLLLVLWCNSQYPLLAQSKPIQTLICKKKSFTQTIRMFLLTFIHLRIFNLIFVWNLIISIISIHPLFTKKKKQNNFFYIFRFVECW